MDEPFDTKVAVVLLEDLPVWQKANAAAFLVSGIAGSTPGLVGEAYVNGTGNRYLPMLRQPILIYAPTVPVSDERTRERWDGRSSSSRSSHVKAFSTPHDTANRAAVAAVPAGELDLVAIARRADRKIVDKVLDKLLLHS